MIATEFGPYSCRLGEHRVTYATLRREYRCAKCGGRIVIKMSEELGIHPECGLCGSLDFVHENEWERQRWEAIEVLEGLPEEMARELGLERPLAQPIRLWEGPADI